MQHVHTHVHGQHQTCEYQNLPKKCWNLHHK